MRVLALPREDTNPYQSLLYGEMHREGVQVSYLGKLTPSHSLNILLLPLELAVRRLTGARIVHLHWVYAFGLYGADRFPFLQRAAYAAFTLSLWTMHVLGMKLVWTAHNVLPASPVFPDDIRARRQLASACDLVIVHSKATLDALAALGIVPRKSAVIPHGPFRSASPSQGLRTPGSGSGPRQLLFFGKVRDYKGVEDLLTAFNALPTVINAQLTVAGECGDPALSSVLTALAAGSPGRVVLRLERVPDEDVACLIERADVVVLPFRKITTSGSALLALCHGRPLVIPALPALADLPDDAVLRYDGSVHGLTDALSGMILADASVLAKMSAVAQTYGSTLSWSEIAEQTIARINHLDR